MIGIAELILATISFIIIWFIIFKVIIAVKESKIKKNIPEKLEKQDKRYFNGSEEIDLKKELGFIKEKKDKEEKEKKEEKNKKAQDKLKKKQEKLRKELEEKKAKLEEELKIEQEKDE